MKKRFRISLIVAMLVTAPMLMLAHTQPNRDFIAASVHHTHSAAGSNEPKNVVLTTLLAMAVAYGAGKFFWHRHKNSMVQ